MLRHLTDTEFSRLTGYRTTRWERVLEGLLLLSFLFTLFSVLVGKRLLAWFANSRLFRLLRYLTAALKRVVRNPVYISFGFTFFIVTIGGTMLAATFAVFASSNSLGAIAAGYAMAALFSPLPGMWLYGWRTALAGFALNAVLLGGLAWVAVNSIYIANNPGLRMDHKIGTHIQQLEESQQTEDPPPE